MTPFHIFIVEDDLWYGEILSYHIGLNPDYIVTRYEDGKSCLDNLYQRPNLIIIDFSLPDIKGDLLFKKIKEAVPSVPVIVVSSQEDVSTAVNLLKMGVSDYLVKDDATKELLWNSINRIRENQELKQEVELLKEELAQKYTFEKILIGESEAIKKVFRLMTKALNTNINVSITGETGTGKELVAKAIHFNSDRKKKPLVAVNMAAIPATLLESELFGYEKGAFTGAVTSKKGKFEEANGGTLFLDEVAELDLALQSKILRAIQEREITRLGGVEKISLNFRLITATNKNLQEEVKKGTFREDLYYRLLGLPIELPPLRDRGNDIVLLAQHFVNDFAVQNKIGGISLSSGAKKKLLGYPFPGNVRELKALVELAAVMCENRTITESDFTYFKANDDENLFAEPRTLKEYTSFIIKQHLRKNNNDVLLTAQQLEIGKSTIYNMMKSGGLA